MKKTEGWEQRLAAFIEGRSRARFERCVHDCCSFTAGAVHAMTGYDGMARHEGVRSAASVARVLRDAGGVHAMPAVHGFRKLESVALASRGDIVASFTDAGKPGRKLEALGVCLGQSSAFAAIIGYETIKTRECVAAWRVE